MDLMKSVRRLRLAFLLVVALWMFAVACDATAVPLLFVPHSGKFPYHFVGKGGHSNLPLGESLKNSFESLESPEVHVLTLILNATLSDTTLLFLKVRNTLGEPCSNVTGTENVAINNIVGHLGFAHHEKNFAIPAILLLLGRQDFKCKIFGVETLVVVLGAVIGQITSPALNTASTLLLINYKQVKGEQLLTQILLGNELLTGQSQLTVVGGAAEEKTGQEGHATLHALPGEGTFLLVAP